MEGRELPAMSCYARGLLDMQDGQWNAAMRDLGIDGLRVLRTLVRCKLA